MAWQVKEQYVHKGIGHHVVHLHEPTSGAEHILQIVIGHEACDVCGHVKVAENVAELDPRALIENEIAELEKAHAQAHHYARKHGVPVVGADGKAR